jgi:hypothetical protein
MQNPLFTLRLAALAMCAWGQYVAMPLALAETTSLPLKNLLIEVRQIRSETADAQGVNFQTPSPLTNRSFHRDAQSVQQSLVLNGRPVRLMSSTSTPWLLRQSYLRNGTIVSLPSTVWTQTGTGFSATPRWSGDAFAELELQAQQDLTAMGLQKGSVVQQASSAQVLVPLNEWTTVAQGASSQSSQQRGIGQYQTDALQDTMELQVRISVP